MTGPTGRRERLTAADASNIVIDAPDQVNVFLMAGVLAPGGPVRADGTVDVDAVRATFGERLSASPRLSQRVIPVGRAYAWDPAPPDLGQHVRLVEPVEGRAGFAALCARLMVTPLPLDRPLWELLVVPGVAPRRAGVVLRIHHAVADGLAAVRLVEALLRSHDPSGSTDAAPASVTAATEPAPGHRVRGRLKTFASGIERTLAVFHRAVPRTALVGRIGPRRGVAFVDAPLDAVAAGASTVGATVNDALLAAVVAAAEAALRERGERVPATLPASVPVAIDRRGGSGNAVGVMLVPLPTGEPDPASRLRRISQLTRPLVADARARGAYELTRSRLGTRLFKRFVRYQRLIVMFVSNVPGPRHPLTLGGAPLERVWPLGAIQGNVRLGIAALSYDGVLGCAVHCDADAVSADVFANSLHDEFGRIAALG